MNVFSRIKLFFFDFGYLFFRIAETWRNASRAMRRHLPKFLYKLLCNMRLIVVVLAIGALLALFFGRLTTVALSINPTNPIYALFTLSSDLDVLMDLYMTNPLYLATDNNAVMIAVCLGFLLPVLLGMRAIGTFDPSIEESGSEYGEDRFANRSEMMALADKKHFFNNLIISENSRIVFEGYNKKTDSALRGRNKNEIVFGLSGTGKTFNISKPEILQSVGNSLPYMQYGLRNIPDHFDEFWLTRMIFFTLRYVRKHPTQTNALPAREVIQAQAEVYDAPSAPTNSTEQNELSATAPRSELADPCKPTSAFSDFKSALAQELKANKKADRESLLGGGFDLINTDPKGVNLADVGNLLESAGTLIYSFNTLDTLNSDRYNPLAFIETRRYDVQEADKLSFDLEATCTLVDESIDNEQSFEITTSKPVSVKQPFHWSDWVEDPNDINATVSLNAYMKATTQITSYEDEDTLSPMDRGQDYIDENGALQHIPSYFEDMKARGIAKNGEEQLSDILTSFTYRHTTGEIHLDLENLSSCDLTCEIVVRLDRSMMITNIATDEDGSVGYEILNKSLEDIQRTGVLRVKVADLCPNEHVPISIDLEFETQSTAMPDGVMLSKTVECLVSQLTPSPGDKAAEDPFWEDCKRLAFIALIAYQFEALPRKYWNLPTTIELLDLMLPENGCSKSALDVLMEEWESGYTFVPDKKERKRGRPVMLQTGVGGTHEKGHYEALATPPHSRSQSLALHCYYAIRNSADDTVKSVVATCQTAFVRLVSPEMRDLLSVNELPLDKLGEADIRRALFLISSDQDHTFDFLLSLVVFQLITLLCDKAYKDYGGALPRHVRFILDEVMNLGNIQILNRALAVVRSRNISLAMYVQSKAQIEKVYGHEDTDIMLDNCSNLIYLGAQSEDTLKMFSERIGKKTVQTRTMQRSFNNGGENVSENIQTTGQDVKSPSELARLDIGLMLSFCYGCRPIIDKKFPTHKHPLYPYIDATSRRTWLQPKAVFDKDFDFADYRTRRAKYLEEAKHEKN